MLKKAVRLGILSVLVLSFMFSIAGSQAVKAEQSENIFVQADAVFWIMDTAWNGSFDPASWNWSAEYEVNAIVDNMTIGELKSMLKEELGYPVIILAAQWESCEDYSDFDYAEISLPADGNKLLDYPTCPDEWAWVDFVIFKAPSASENARLTLYGYVNDGGKSCVLWSLDGSHPLNVDKKCGGGTELVCKVKLVDKNFKYDCEGGYDWLGEQIVHDPQWLSWADKFASMNGNK
jgi:hypothetical protein